MPDPTIPELVARLREIYSEWGDNWTLGIDEAGNLLVLDGEGEFVGALHEDSDRLAEAVCELRKALPAILDALERGTATRAEEPPPSDPWRPISQVPTAEEHAW